LPLTPHHFRPEQPADILRAPQNQLYRPNLREGGDAGAAANYLREIAKAEAELAVIDLKISSSPEWDARIGRE
jgi:hypothetical protein